jgi:hypothetical protein
MRSGAPHFKTQMCRSRTTNPKGRPFPHRVVIWNSFGGSTLSKYFTK